MLKFGPGQPEVFPDIYLGGEHGTGVIIPDGQNLGSLAAGFNSSAWRIGNHVVKATKQAKAPDDALELLDTMRYEHDVLAEYIGEYMPETEYFIAPQKDGNKAHVVTVQPFVEGKHIREFLINLNSPVDPLKEFLAKSREVFKEECLMPDIACVEDGFNVLTNSNILIREDQDAQPMLVDTTFGKTQRHNVLGPLWTRFIYAGSFTASARLVLERPRQTDQTPA